MSRTDLSRDPGYAALVRRRNLVAAIAVVLGAVVVATAVLDEVLSVHEDRTFSVSASPRLIVRDGVGGGLSGGIEVHAGAADTLRVEGKVHGSWRVRYTLAQSGDDVAIDVQPRPLLGWLSFLGPARFTITAPPATRLDIESKSSPIDLEGITGGSVRTTNGYVELTRSGGTLSASTTNGWIAAEDFDGAAKLHTTNGSIDVRGGRGAFDVSTTNGGVSIDAELTGGGRHRAQTVNGGVTVRLRGEPNLAIDARTTNGGVTVGRVIDVREQTAKSLTGTIGNGTGAGELALRTTNGGITIE